MDAMFHWLFIQISIVDVALSYHSSAVSPSPVTVAQQRLPCLQTWVLGFICWCSMFLSTGPNATHDFCTPGVQVTGGTMYFLVLEPVGSPLPCTGTRNVGPAQGDFSMPLWVNNVSPNNTVSLSYMPYFSFQLDNVPRPINTTSTFSC